MKKFFLLLLGAFLFWVGADAQTNISSNFTVNTTLTAANSPYTVTTNININDGVTVTVEDGVEIKFNDHDRVGPPRLARPPLELKT